MLEARSILRRFAVDAFRILFAGFPFIVYYARKVLFHHRHKGGFFCDDKSLMFPYKGQTISSSAVLLHTTIAPICVFVLVEFFIHKTTDPKLRGCLIGKAYTNIVNYTVGYLVAVSLMWIPKFFDGAGGLRPHFFDLCQPVMADGTTCRDPINLGRFIEDYTCSRTDYPQRIYRTFPSGHSTVSAFAVIYVLAYLEAKIKRPDLQLPKQALQYLALLYGFFCPVSRIFDNQHHVGDVLVGTFIGAISAVLVIKFVVRGFEGCLGEPEAVCGEKKGK